MILPFYCGALPLAPERFPCYLFFFFFFERGFLVPCNLDPSSGYSMREGICTRLTSGNRSSGSSSSGSSGSRSRCEYGGHVPCDSRPKVRLKGVRLRSTTLTSHVLDCSGG
jgi:hypothetical protein